MWVSEIGARHLVDPSRLEASARRLYGDDFDRFWGELVPLPEREHQDRRRRRGRLGGVPDAGPRLAPRLLLPRRRAARGRRVRRPAPAGARTSSRPRRRPTSTSRRGTRSLDEIARREPECLALIHFGVEGDVPDHLARLHEELDRWAGWVRDGMSQEEFVARARETGRSRRRDPRRDRRARPVVARTPALLGQARRGAAEQRLVGRQVVRHHPLGLEALLGVGAARLGGDRVGLLERGDRVAPVGRRSRRSRPGSITSGTAPQRDAITGVPHAIDSIITRPNGSSHSIGKSVARACWSSSTFSPCADLAQVLDLGGQVRADELVEVGHLERLAHLAGRASAAGPPRSRCGRRGARPCPAPCGRRRAGSRRGAARTGRGRSRARSGSWRSSSGAASACAG